MAKVMSGLWVEDFRPKRINDMILPKDFKKFFNKVIKNENLPNLILYSPTPRNW